MLARITSARLYTCAACVAIFPSSKHSWFQEQTLMQRISMAILHVISLQSLDIRIVWDSYWQSTQLFFQRILRENLPSTWLAATKFCKRSKNTLNPWKRFSEKNAKKVHQVQRWQAKSPLIVLIMLQDNFLLMSISWKNERKLSRLRFSTRK